MDTNVVIVFISSILTVIVTRIVKKKFSHFYFSINQILVSSEDKLTIAETIFLFLPIYIGSFILSLILGQDSLYYVLLYGFLTPFLIIWPILLYDIHLLPYEAYKKRSMLYLLYLFYVITMIVTSYGGYYSSWSIYSLLYRKDLTITSFLSFYASVNPFIQNIIWWIVVIILSWIVTSLKKRLIRGKKND